MKSTWPTPRPTPSCSSSHSRRSNVGILTRQRTQVLPLVLVLLVLPARPTASRSPRARSRTGHANSPSRQAAPGPCRSAGGSPAELPVAPQRIVDVPLATARGLDQGGSEAPRHGPCRRARRTSLFSAGKWRRRADGDGDRCRLGCGCGSFAPAREVRSQDHVPTSSRSSSGTTCLTSRGGRR
jgi:hypothetical protein